MIASALSYVQAVNRLSDDLLSSHRDLLGRKNIRNKGQLLQLIKIDLDKLTHALVEVKENRAPAVLQRFFETSSVDWKDVRGHLVGPSIYHVGFEIHEPIDLVLYGINHWIEQSKRSLGVNMRVCDRLRFPASIAFQQRVGAYTEILRIWLEVDETVLMLELFDIHRPADSAIQSAPKPTHRNFHGLFRVNDAAQGHGNRLNLLFGTDPIWHYALYVRGPADVMELHSKFKELAVSNSNYTLPYEAPVYNQHDRSFHTKIVRPANEIGTRLELEFVTQKPAQACQI